MKARATCKYGHLKKGDNLLLRPRHIESVRITQSGKRRPFKRDYVERVCRICLNRQKREWDAKQQRSTAYRDAIRKQELAEQKIEHLTSKTVGEPNDQANS